jgi:hypothetical protein
VRGVLPLSVVFAGLVGCTEKGRSLVLVNVGGDSGLTLSHVVVVVSLTGSDRQWPVQRAWIGETLRLGIYLPQDVRGDVSASACGFDATGGPLAFGAGAPATVGVLPGGATPEIDITLQTFLSAPGSSPGDCRIAGGSDGGADDAVDDVADAAGGADSPPDTFVGGPDAADGGGDAVLAGFLAVAWADPLPFVDLTAEGTIDWAHWGAVNQSSFNHKASGGRKISNVAPTPQYHLPVAGSFRWTDGTPIASLDTVNGVYSNYFAEEPSMFSWTIEASTALRTLRLYIGVDGVSTLIARLSDGSAPDVRFVVDSNSMPVDVTFRATSTPQTLSLIWESTSTTAVPYGSMFLWAATMF